MRRMRYFAWALVLCFVMTSCGSESATPAGEIPAVSSTGEESPTPLDSSGSEPSSEAASEAKGASSEKGPSESDGLGVDPSLTGEALLQSITGQDFKKTSYWHVMEYVREDGSSTQNITWVDASGNTRTEMSLGEGQGVFIDIYLVDEGVSYQFQANTTYGMIYRDDETNDYDEDDDGIEIDLGSGFLEDGALLIKAEIQNHKGHHALYVEMESPEMDGSSFTVHTKYWMSLEFGILLEAETRMNDSVVYIMRTVDFKSGINPDPALFIVPEGIEFQDMSFDFLDDMEMDDEDLDWLNEWLDDDDDE